jgi:hypothetical protein
LLRAPLILAKLISVDDIDSFSQIRKSVQTQNHIKPLPEKKLKLAFAKIIAEKGSFKDWGGEKSDLYTTKLRFRGRRIPAAIAFKGKATKGKLVPRKMEKNGDQINRLFDEPAQVFLVVYGGQIDSSIISQMQAFAIGNAIKGGRIYYGVVDGSDIDIFPALPVFPRAAHPFARLPKGWDSRVHQNGVYWCRYGNGKTSPRKTCPPKRNLAAKSR